MSVVPEYAKYMHPGEEGREFGGGINSSSCTISCVRTEKTVKNAIFPMSMQHWYIINVRQKRKFRSWCIISGGWKLASPLVHY